jgi:hypothetical protein
VNLVVNQFEYTEEQLSDRMSDIMDVLLNVFNYNLTKTQNIAKRYYNSATGEFKWFTYADDDPHKIHFKSAILNQYSKRDQANSTTYGCSRYVTQKSIIYDFDYDHSSKSNSVLQGQYNPDIWINVLRALEKLHGRPATYVEFKSTGNAHIVFNTDKNVSHDMLQQLEVYVQTHIHPAIEIHKGGTIFRFPFSSSYTPVNPENILEPWNNLEWVSYCQDIMKHKSVCSLEQLLVKISYKQPKAKRGPKVAKRGDVQNFVFGQFENGARFDEIQRTGFIRYAACGCDAEALAQHLYENAGSSDDYQNYSKCLYDAKKIAQNFNAAELGNGNIVHKKHVNIITDHLMRLSKNQLKTIDCITALIDRYDFLDYSPYKKVRAKENKIATEVLKWILASIDLQNELIIPNRQLSDKFVSEAEKCGLNNNQIDKIANGVVMNIPVLVKHIQNLGLGSEKVSYPIIKKLIQLLKDASIIQLVLEHRYVPRNISSHKPAVGYQRQYKSIFHSVLDRIANVFTIIVSYFRALYKDYKRTRRLYTLHLSNDKRIDKGDNSAKTEGAEDSEGPPDKTNIKKEKNMTLFDEIKAKIKNAHVDPCADDIITLNSVNNIEYVRVEDKRFQYKREEPVWSLASEQEK